MVAIPAHFDHDLNARAVVARGLGVSIFPHELTAERLRKAVDKVVNSPQVALNLKRFQLILAKRHAPEQGAELVLEFARRKKQPLRTRSHDTAWFPTSPVVLEEVACDLCGEMQNQLEREIEDAIFHDKQVYAFVRCKNCGLVYCSPRPSQNSLWFDEKGFYIAGNGVYWKKRLSDTTWTLDDSQPSLYKDRIRGNGQNDVMIAGSGGLVSHFNGSTWGHFAGNELPLWFARYTGLSMKGNLVAIAGWKDDRAVAILGRRN